MITSFRHAGLERFFLTGSKAGIQPKHESKLRVLLTRLNQAKQPEDMNCLGWGFHSLSGRSAHRYAVKVNGNWRLTFEFNGEDAEIVDYEDYH